MKGSYGNRGIEDRNGQKWTRGVVISLLFHVLLFSLVFFVPESMPTRRMGGAPVYEVNLVEMPTAGPPAVSKAASEPSAKEISRPKAVPVARRIAPPVQEEKPVVIGKRVVERKKEAPKAEIKKPTQPAVSPSKLIDGAISKIEKKVKAEKTNHLAQAISRIESRTQGDAGNISGTGSGGSDTAITIRMYQLAVEEQVKSNWSYPVALMDPKKRKGLEAVVVVKVRQDGTVLKSWFTEKSASPVFDGSVLRAIERSDPLPPFPEGYIKSDDEIEIRFDLSELEDY